MWLLLLLLLPGAPGPEGQGASGLRLLQLCVTGESCKRLAGMGGDERIRASCGFMGRHTCSHWKLWLAWVREAAMEGGRVVQGLWAQAVRLRLCCGVGWLVLMRGGCRLPGY